MGEANLTRQRTRLLQASRVLLRMPGPKHSYKRLTVGFLRHWFNLLTKTDSLRPQVVEVYCRGAERGLEFGRQTVGRMTAPRKSHFGRQRT